MNHKFSLAITTFNRASLLIPKIKKWECYELIDEILISDDCSDDCEILKNHPFTEKVKIFCNPKNLGSYKNKINILQKVKNNWSILFDSDNDFDENYLNSIIEESNINELKEDVLYCPIESRPHFNYNCLKNIIVDKNYWNSYHDSSFCGFAGFVNTCNFCISKKAIDVLTSNLNIDNTNPIAVDSKYIVYILLKNNFIIKPLENMWYTHPISADSFYIKNQYESANFDKSFDWRLI